MSDHQHAHANHLQEQRRALRDRHSVEFPLGNAAVRKENDPLSISSGAARRVENESVSAGATSKKTAWREQQVQSDRRRPDAIDLRSGDRRPKDAPPVGRLVLRAGVVRVARTGSEECGARADKQHHRTLERIRAEASGDGLRWRRQAENKMRGCSRDCERPGVVEHKAAGEIGAGPEAVVDQIRAGRPRQDQHTEHRRQHGLHRCTSSRSAVERAPNTCGCQRASGGDRFSDTAPKVVAEQGRERWSA